MAKSKEKKAFEQDKPSPPKNETEEVRRWMDRITTAQKYRDRCSDDEGWERFINEYRGTYDVQLGGITAPPVGEVFAYVQSSIAGLYFKNPHMAINPRSKGTIRGARIIETALAYFWRELSVKEEIESEIIDAILVGHGWHKDGTTLTTEGENDNLRVTDEGLISARVSWRDVVFNIGSRKPYAQKKDCQWMAIRVIMPTMDAREKYGIPMLKGGKYPSLSDQEYKDTLYKDDLDFSVIWEIHDAREKKIRLVCEGHDKYLKKPIDWPAYMDEYPLNMLYFNLDPDKPYPISDISPWEAQILETIKLWAMLLDHMKRWNRQGFYKEGAIKDQDLDKYQMGVDGSLIPVAGNPGEIIKFVDYGTMPPDIYTILDRLDGLKRRIHGQPEFEQGGTTPTRTRTLGELSLVKAGAKSRSDRKIDRIEVHCENIARHMIAHMQANFDLPKIAKITGELPEDVIKSFGDAYNKETNSITFTKEDIVGEYDVTVKAGSTLPLDRMTRMEVLEKVLEKIVALAQVPNLPPYIGEVIKAYLADLDIKSLEAAFDSQAQGEEQTAIIGEARAKLQDEKMQADADSKRAKAEKLRTDADVSIAKVAGELLAPEQEGVPQNGM